MALSHAAPGQLIDVRPLGAALATSRSHALFKSADLEVIRLVLLKGQKMPGHSVAGEITLQCIEGHIEFSCDAGPIELRTGQLVHAAGQEVHGLHALEDASLLLTISLKPAGVLPDPPAG